MSPQAAKDMLDNDTDDNKISLRQIDDLLSKLIQHQALESMRKVLAQVKTLEQERDGLQSEIKQLDTCHQETIHKLEQQHEEVRNRYITDFGVALEGLKRENSGLEEENGRLVVKMKHEERKMTDMKQKETSQAAEIKALGDQLAKQEQLGKSAARELSETRKTWAEAQKAAEDFDAALKKRDTTEGLLRNEAAALQKRLQDCQAQGEKSKKTLEKIKEFVAQPVDMTTEALAGQFDGVWTRCLNFVHSVVNENLSKEVLENKSTWHSLETEFVRLPLPQSNSLCAKSMRAIIILMVLAKALTRYIFTPTYLLSEAGELDDVLSMLAEKDPSHERFVRSVLLRPFADHEATNIRDRAEKLKRFGSDLQSLVESIARTWTKFQNNKTHFRASSEMNNELEPRTGWKALKLPIDMDDTFADPLPDDLVVEVLFPRLFSVDQEDDKSIRPAIAVVSSQLREAEEENRVIKTGLAISGEAPQVPVVSSKSGNVYEKRLIQAYISENGTEPTSGEALSTEDLIDVKAAKVVRPRPPTLTSIPALLSVFQEEWDALALESYTLRQSLVQTRQDLSNALYQNDAAVRVIARLTRERDELRKALSEVQVAAPMANGRDSMHVDPAPLPESIKAKIERTQESLSKTRRKRPVPEEWATGDDISAFATKLTTPPLLKGGSSVSVHKAGDLVLVGGVEGAADVYSLSQNKAIQTLSSGGGAVTDTLWAGDGPVLASSTGKVLVFSAQSDAELASFATHSGSVTGIALHPSGDLLASVGEDGTYALYDLVESRPLTQVSSGSNFTCGQFHPDGHLLAAGSEDGNIRIYDIKSGAQAAVFEVGSALQQIVFSENGIWLAALVRHSSAISIWDIRKAAEIKRLDTGGVIESLDWDYTGQFLAAAGPSGVSVAQYSKAAKEWTQPLTVASPATSVAWGPAAKSLVAASEDGVVRVLGRSHAEITRSTSRSLSPRPAKRYRTALLPTSSPALSVLEPARRFVGDGFDYRAPAMASTLESASPSSDLFESASPTPPPALARESGQREDGERVPAAPPFGRGTIEIVDLVDLIDGDGNAAPRQAAAETAIPVRSSSPEIEFVSERPAAAPLRPATAAPAWATPLPPDHRMARALGMFRDGTQQLLRNFPFPFMMPDGQALGVPDDGDDMQILDGDEYARLNLDYQQAAFAMGNAFDADPRRDATRQDYKAPPEPKEGFIRSYDEESVLICPMCGDELAANGDNDDDPKRQVWIVKACGHVYCGRCTLSRTVPKSVTKRDGRKNNRHEGPQFRHCKVDGCNKLVTNKQSMIQIYL
ncbi:hypothetical protein DV736_g3387, partial [Chaetothyriales sp. CBS 134916]